MVQKCRYLAKNVSFWPNSALYGPKILIFTGVSKSFGTHITENHLDNLFELFLVRQWLRWAKNADIWPKMSVLGQIWPFFGQKFIFWGDGVKLLVLLYDHLGVPNNIQPSLGNFEPVWGVHAKNSQKYHI